jgi:DUF4097 and DUF4098 domain-containing protein YvlB
MRPSLCFLIGALLSLVLVLANGRAAWADPPHESTVTATADATVRIHVLSGTLRVVGWDRREVRVTGSPDLLTVTTSNGGAEVSITGPRLDATTLEVSVPSGAHVEARTMSASITVRGVSGPLQLGAVGGDIDVSGASHDVEVGSVSGAVKIALGKADVRVTSISGDVKVRSSGGGSAYVKTVSGGIDIGGAPMSRVEARSVSGDVALDLRPQGEGPFIARTHSGSIHVVLPKDAPVAVDVRRLHDHHHDEAPDAAAPSPSGHTVLTLSSFSGDIAVDRR